MTRRLGHAEHEDEHRQREDQGRPERERTQELVRLGGEKKNAAADDGVDAHRHQAPQADGSDQALGHFVTSLNAERRTQNSE